MKPLVDLAGKRGLVIGIAGLWGTQKWAVVPWPEFALHLMFWRNAKGFHQLICVRCLISTAHILPPLVSRIGL